MPSVRLFLGKHVARVEQIVPDERGDGGEEFGDEEREAAIAQNQRVHPDDERLDDPKADERHDKERDDLTLGICLGLEGVFPIGNEAKGQRHGCRSVIGDDFVQPKPSQEEEDTKVDDGIGAADDGKAKFFSVLF